MSLINKKQLFKIIKFPLLFILLIWVIKFYEYLSGLSFIQFGIYPQKISGLKGIFFSPFIHNDISHLANNSIPLFLLSTMLFYFYKKIASKVLILILIISGFWLWCIGRPSYHIGASCIIYGLAGFIFISGIIRRQPELSSISLIVTFIYGGLIWGVFPIKDTISWEGHLSGLLSGIVLAFYFRKKGPKPKKYQWEIDEENESELREFIYHYKKKN